MTGESGEHSIHDVPEVIVMTVIRVIGDDNAIAFAGVQRNFELNEKRIKQYVEASVMLATALSPVIGYDMASAIAYKAKDDGLTLRDAALKSGDVTEKQFDDAVDPKKMASHGLAGA